MSEGGTAPDDSSRSSPDEQPTSQQPPSISLDDRLKMLPEEPGVYIIKDAAGRAIYIGKATSLRDRVPYHFRGGDGSPRARSIVEEGRDLEWLVTESEVEALLAEARLVKDVRPKYNIELKDDKSFPFLEVTTGDDFPGVYFTRDLANRKSTYYGPFTEAKTLRRSVQVLQSIFRFRTCHKEIRADDDRRQRERPCLLYHIARCSGPCACLVDRATYRRDIASLRTFLEGRRTPLLKELVEGMDAASKDLRFEEAARLRDQITALEGLARRGEFEKEVDLSFDFIDPAEGVSELRETLGVEAPPRLMDGLDISDIAGSEAAGSAVTFIDGVPFREGYRRYRVRRRGPNDVAMIAEVVRRRYRRAADDDTPFADLVMIDGGKGHVAAAAREFERLGRFPAVLIGLAKKNELIFVHGREAPLRLPRRSMALRVLQHLRDEAHRFAQHYHHILRRKRVMGE